MDYLIFQKLNDLAERNTCLDSVFVFFADYLGYLLIIILLLFLFKDFKKYRPVIIKAFLSAVLARFMIQEIIEFFWRRSRPFIENNVNILINQPSTFSFPSGHATFYFALSTVVYSYNKKTGLLFYSASFLISISRVISGVHWPSDVLAGALIGIFSGWLVMKILKNKNI